VLGKGVGLLVGKRGKGGKKREGIREGIGEC
jgi:hypothetical protein